MAALHGAEQLRFCREFMCRKGQEIRNKADRRKYQLEWHPDRPHCKTSEKAALECRENFQNMNACIDEANYYCVPDQSEAEFQKMLDEMGIPPAAAAQKQQQQQPREKLTKKQHEEWKRLIDEVEAAVKLAMVDAEYYLAAMTVYRNIYGDVMGDWYEQADLHPDKRYLRDRLNELDSQLERQPVILHLEKEMTEENKAILKAAFSVPPNAFLEKVQKRRDLLATKIQYVLDQQKGIFDKYIRNVLHSKLDAGHPFLTLEHIRQLVKTREWILGGMPQIDDPYHDLMVSRDEKDPVKRYNKLVLDESNIITARLERYGITKEDSNRMRRNYKIPVPRQPRKVKEKEKEAPGAGKGEKKERKKKAKTEKEKSPPGKGEKQEKKKEEKKKSPPKQTEEAEEEEMTFKRKPRRRRQLGEGEEE